MTLTAEQKAIIQSKGDIRINAVAGSGKTSTIIEYAKARPNSRILYLAFNKAVKLEAVRKFEAQQLGHVKVETAHSLAYKAVVFKHNYKVRAAGYKTAEIVSMLSLRSSGERHAEHILANHIIKFVAYFCNSDKQRVQDLNYAELVTDKVAQKFVKQHYEALEMGTRRLLAMMDKGEVEIIHDFYLKKFQLMAPRLPYDFILFDEGQDASAAMLDVFFRQTATKVIVGDTHQQIYGWRFAVNSLEKADFKTYQLSTSFRFGQDIADLAKRVLSYKAHIDQEIEVTINGKGAGTTMKSKAVIARSNLGLLLAAIGQVQEGKLKKIYFEGNLNSYTYADEGASLYDVLNLYNDKKQLIRDEMIGGMKDMKDLEEYIEKTEDKQLGMMVEIVKEYGNELPIILNSIRAKHVSDNDKDKADMVFSTVHRCKGIEYDEVTLADDFITEVRLKKIKDDKKKEDVDLARLNEEINLLYVAVTRAKRLLYMPDDMMPEGFSFTSHIKALPMKKRLGVKEAVKPGSKGGTATGNWKKLEKGWDKPDGDKVKYRSGGGSRAIGNESVNKLPAGRVGGVADKLKLLKRLVTGEEQAREAYEQASREHAAANKAWTNTMDDELTIMYGDGVGLAELSEHFGRTKGAVQMRIRKLGLD
ncbi:UvrD-helicase domain-containing protein [Paraflavitalea sp. CAU 1676]|uniref:UvrD-helicase domain-containing protein n=1 Tax=Paraflavitalea sp. CAU 1676 TaxID=3032598 RepID=UPI0023D9962E|nr:UvrD-helicase domain-containing protein [Paraflavitalea sp. CAU 1676]MDF2191412.1 3'-5' exonuclease [Paraflavitalea sp. CAU 1676]